MRTDLHCHSRKSDGCMAVEALVRYAARAKIDCLALTDHDTFAGVDEAVSVGREVGVRVIPGMEASAIDPQTGRKVHILCYCPRDRAPLEAVCRGTLDSRRRSGQYMLEKACELFPLGEEDVRRYSDQSETIYKQHIMNALMDLGYSASIIGDDFKRLFGKGGPLSAKNEYPTVQQVLEAGRASGALVVIAHPGDYDSYALCHQLAPTGAIDGIEVYHVKNDPDRTPELQQLCRENGLLEFGGTDFHGFYTKKVQPLGSFMAPDETARALLARMEE